MTILELIKKSAVMLNIRQILDDDSLDNINYDNEQSILSDNFTLTRLFEFAKLVVNEVYSYAPSFRQVEFTAVDKKISLVHLSNFVKIISVKQDDRYVKYSINSGRVVTVDRDGKYLITYSSCPDITSVVDSIEINNGDITDDIFVYGLSSYYCLAMGLFAEFNIYNAQYVDRLSHIKHLKLFAMPCRSWND